MTTVCVLVAAGNGTRLAAGRPKAFVDLDGEPLVVHAARRVRSAPCVDDLVLVVPVGLECEASRLVPDAHVVVGGSTRQASVRAGVEAAPAEADVVLVHDAARCLAPSVLVDAVVSAVRAGAPAVVPGVPVTDTVRSLDGGVVDRSRLVAVQTPQGFRRDVLQRAHAQAPAGSATDDAGLVERLGVPVLVVPGHPEAFKITDRLDLALARSIVDGADR